MPYKKGIEQRLQDKAKLVLRVNYFTGISSLVFYLLCFFVLDITRIIPFVFLAFGILNLANTFLYKYHKNLTLTYNIVSIMTWIGATIITLYSGGINSPFIFVLALIIVAGYVATKSYGTLYLNINLLII
ncbi:MAG: sensor histidine kinase, partial [Bacteroidota bacterium]